MSIKTIFCSANGSNLASYMFVTTIMGDNAESAGGSSNHYHFGLYAENSHWLAAILN
jgi:hypothetical protein